MISDNKNTNVKVRLMKDLARVEKSGEDDGILASPKEDSIFKWDAIIFGPENTPWEGGIFKLTIVFGEEYPIKPPQIKFITKVFHPNVYADGRICLDILDKNWSPAYDVLSVLISLRSLLSDPNENSPANVEAAKLYKEEAQQYHMKVKQCVEKSIQDQDKEDKEDCEIQKNYTELDLNESTGNSTNFTNANITNLNNGTTTSEVSLTTNVVNVTDTILQTQTNTIPLTNNINEESYEEGEYDIFSDMIY